MLVQTSFLTPQYSQAFLMSEDDIIEDDWSEALREDEFSAEEDAEIDPEEPQASIYPASDDTEDTKEVTDDDDEVEWS